MAKMIMAMVQVLLKENIPHNLLMVNETIAYLIIRGFAKEEVPYGCL